jgi:hypothetical protein
MNERIRELAEQAWGATAVSPDFGHPVSFAEKFAEMIVKECCFIGEQWADGLFDPKHYAFVNKQIKNHFGVEE